MPAVPSRDWQHPWLRVTLLLRAILHGEWSSEQWRAIRPEIPRVLALQSRIRRAGWFN